MDPLTSPAVTNAPPPPEQNSSAVWGPVATIAWTVLIAIVWLLAQIFIAGIYIAVTRRDLPRDKIAAAIQALEFDGLFLSLCTFAAVLFCVPLIAGIAKLKRGSKLKEYLALRLPRPRELWRWSLIIVACCLLTDLVFVLLRQPTIPEFMLKTYGSTNPRWILWLALALAAPLSEEIFFRGFLFKGLADSRLRWYGATIVTSVLWAAIHVQYDWYGTSAVFALGLVLGTARALTDSTLLTIWLHGLVNILATVQTAIALRQI